MALRLRATACSELGYYSLALTHWEKCISFAATHCPPHDESMVCYSIHATLAALAAGQREVAAAHAEVAARTPQRQSRWLSLSKHRLLALNDVLCVGTHQVAFGGGKAFLRRRYEQEVRTFGAMHAATLWELVQAASGVS